MIPEPPGQARFHFGFVQETEFRAESRPACVRVCVYVYVCFRLPLCVRVCDPRNSEETQHGAISISARYPRVSITA